MSILHREEIYNPKETSVFKQRLESAAQKIAEAE
jgi:hypothetical protein